MGSSSLFSMLHEEAPPPRAAPASGAAAGALELTNGRKEKKAKKEYKDKKEKKEKKAKKNKQVRLARCQWALCTHPKRSRRCIGLELEWRFTAAQEKVGAAAQRDVLQPPASQPAAGGVVGSRDRSGVPPDVPRANRCSRVSEDRDRDGSRHEDRRESDAARHARRRSTSPADRRHDRDQRERGHRQRSRSPAERHRRR